MEEYELDAEVLDVLYRSLARSDQSQSGDAGSSNDSHDNEPRLPGPLPVPAYSVPVRCHISYVKSPCDFFVRFSFAAMEGFVEDFIAQMNSWYGGASGDPADPHGDESDDEAPLINDKDQGGQASISPIEPGSVQSGGVYATKCQADQGDFGRAVVIQKGKEDCLVQFVDSGREQFVLLTNLYPLASHFASIPPLVYHCEVHGVDRRDLWIEKVEDFCRRVDLLNYEVFIRFKDTCNFADISALDDWFRVIHQVDVYNPETGADMGRAYKYARIQQGRRQVTKKNGPNLVKIRPPPQPQPGTDDDDDSDLQFSEDDQRTRRQIETDRYLDELANDYTGPSPDVPFGTYYLREQESRERWKRIWRHVSLFTLVALPGLLFWWMLHYYEDGGMKRKDDL